MIYTSQAIVSGFSIKSCLTFIPDNIRYTIMFQPMKIASYFLFVAFIGAVLVCSFTGVSSHLGILSDDRQAAGFAPVVVDPLKNVVPFNIDDMVLVVIMALAAGLFWPLVHNLHRLLPVRLGFSQRQVRLQAARTRLYNHLLTAFSRGILQPNIY